MRRITLILSLCISCTYLFAGGYGVAIQSQKFLGMAHAGTGLYLDGSAIYFNPGALALQKNRWEFSLGANALFSTGYYQNPETRATSQTENPIGTPVEFFASYKINQHLTAGLGFYTPYGNSLKWPEGWEGRALITNIKLKTYFVQPTLAYHINDWVSIGAGLVIANGDVLMKKDIPAINADLELSGKAKTGFGYNLGVYLQPSEKLSVGINYRSKIQLEIDNGDAKFNVPAALANTKIYTEDTFAAALPMTSSINLGAAYRLTEKLTLAADINFNNWSEYEELNVVFKKNAALSAPQKRDYKSTVTTRIGAQYVVNKKFTARAGFYYDPSPVRKDFFSPETPSMNNLGFTAGGSFQATSRLGIDFSLLVINGLERNVGYKPDNFNGDFRSFAVSPGIGISYKF